MKRVGGGERGKDDTSLWYRKISVPFYSLLFTSSLKYQVQWNYPGATFQISSKETPPIELPFMVDRNGTIYVTEPLDREKKDSVSMTKTSNKLF